VAPVKNSFTACCKLPAREGREVVNGGKVELGEGFRCGREWMWRWRNMKWWRGHIINIKTAATAAAAAAKPKAATPLNITQPNHLTNHSCGCHHDCTLPTIPLHVAHARCWNIAAFVAPTHCRVGGRECKVAEAVHCACVGARGKQQSRALIVTELWMGLKGVEAGVGAGGGGGLWVVFPGGAK
jgi:hypothetical protein